MTFGTPFMKHHTTALFHFSLSFALNHTQPLTESYLHEHAHLCRHDIEFLGALPFDSIHYCDLPVVFVSTSIRRVSIKRRKKEQKHEIRRNDDDILDCRQHFGGVKWGFDGELWSSSSTHYDTVMLAVDDYCSEYYFGQLLRNSNSATCLPKPHVILVMSIIRCQVLFEPNCTSYNVMIPWITTPVRWDYGNKCCPDHVDWENDIMWTSSCCIPTGLGRVSCGFIVIPCHVHALVNALSKSY